MDSHSPNNIRQSKIIIHSDLSSLDSFDTMLHDAIQVLQKPPSIAQEDIPHAIQVRSHQPHDISHLHYERAFSHTHHLSRFKENEINKLIEKYGSKLNIQNTVDLENLIQKNRKLHYGLAATYCISILLNIGFVAFIASTGGNGIKNIINVLANESVDDRVALGIGIPIGILDILLYMSFFHPFKAATKTLLDFLVWCLIPVKTRLHNTAKYIFNTPHVAFKDLLFELMLLDFNAASFMTVLLGFIPFLTTAELIALSIVTLGFGIFYMSQFSNEATREGLQHLLNKNHPSLFHTVFKEKNIAIPLEILLETLSSVGLSAFPLFFYIGTAIAKGYQCDSKITSLLAISTAAFAFIRGIFVMHPLAYDRYMMPSIEFKTTIKKHHANAVIVKQYETKVHEEKSYCALLTGETVGFTQCILRTLIVIGVIALTILDPSPTNILILFACAGILFVGAKSTINRNTTIHAHQRYLLENMPLEIKEEKKEEKPLPVKAPTKLERLAKVLAILLTADSGLADIIVVMGALLIDNNATKLFLLMLALERFRKYIEFSFNNVENTLRSHLIKEPKTANVSLTSVSATLFSNTTSPSPPLSVPPLLTHSFPAS